MTKSELNSNADKEVCALNHLHEVVNKPNRKRPALSSRGNRASRTYQKVKETKNADWRMDRIKLR